MILRRLACLPLVAALAACLPADGPGSPYAPTGAAPGEVSVDGLLVGHRLMEAGEYELALRAYHRAAGDQGATVDVLSAIGSADLKLGRLGQAEQMLRRALEVDETFVPAWNNLGVVLMERGAVAEASRVFRTAYALDSGASDMIRENLRLALAQLEQRAYPGENDKPNYTLVRRGNGTYLLLSTP